MAMLLADAVTEEALLAERRARGADRYDEVWDGLYVMHAYPADEHQEIVNRLCRALTEAIEDAGLGKVRPGVNVASDPDDWQRDYRCPDVVAFLNHTHAVCHGAFCTSVDFAVEVVSPGDKSREKLGFYAQVGCRELLLVDRDPWRLELYRHDGEALPLVAQATVGEAAVVSEVLPIALGLEPGEERPHVGVSHRTSEKRWTV